MALAPRGAEILEVAESAVAPRPHPDWREKDPCRCHRLMVPTTSSKGSSISSRVAALREGRVLKFPLLRHEPVGHLHLNFRHLTAVAPRDRTRAAAGACRVGRGLCPCFCNRPCRLSCNRAPERHPRPGRGRCGRYSPGSGACPSSDSTTRRAPAPELLPRACRTGPKLASIRWGETLYFLRSLKSSFRNLCRSPRISSCATSHRNCLPVTPRRSASRNTPSAISISKPPPLLTPRLVGLGERTLLLHRSHETFERSRARPTPAPSPKS